MIERIMSLATEIPSWTIALFACVFWVGQNRLSKFVRFWALITLPATVLHELAHAAVGFLLAAQPTSFSLWPKRVGTRSWRLGYVAFQRLRWWNGGAVSLAPLLWLLLLVAIARSAPVLPESISLQTSVLLGAVAVWVWIAVAPSRSDWKLATEFWFSGIVFLCLWLLALYALVWHSF